MSIIVRRNNNRPNSFFSPVVERFWGDLWNMSENMRDMFSEFQDNEMGNFALALDVNENENAYSLTTELPGVDADDIHINVEDNILTISAEVNETNVDEGAKVVLRERRYGSFSRSLRLPTNVDASNIDANYENGVLSLEIPKSPEAQPKAIPVKTKS